MTSNDVAFAILTCSGYLLYATGILWLFIILAVLQIIAIGLDFYHLWRRCQERKERLERIVQRQRNRNVANDRPN